MLISADFTYTEAGLAFPGKLFVQTEVNAQKGTLTEILRIVPAREDMKPPSGAQFWWQNISTYHISLKGKNEAQITALLLKFTEEFSWVTGG